MAASENPKRRACDACRLNKTKCDGGVQCSLCAKRSISCTFELATTARPLLFVTGTAVRGDNDTGVSSRPPSQLRPPVLAPESTAQDAPPNNPRPLLDMSMEVLPQDAAGAQPAQLGISMILDGISASPTKSSLAELKAPDAVQIWFTTCCRSYLEHFHHHWAVLHAPPLTWSVTPSPSRQLWS